MDFGIARPLRRNTPDHTQPGTFVGTPHYSAPEQLAGEEVDQRADIYASGVLMCEMFCGKLPYTGANTLEIYVRRCSSHRRNLRNTGRKFRRLWKPSSCDACKNCPPSGSSLPRSWPMPWAP
jgi:serine/threonine protein kinase